MQSNDQIAIYLEQAVVGNATLVFDFSYPLAPGDTGFHLTTFTADDGTEYVFGATHMQVCRSQHPITCFLSKSMPFNACMCTRGRIAAAIR